MANRYAYAQMTGPELSSCLNLLRLSLRDFAYLSGYDTALVQRWLSGYHTIPHHARVIIDAWINTPGTLERAAELANLYAIDRRHSHDA